VRSRPVSPGGEVRDVHGMVLVGASFPDAKAQAGAEVTCEPRMLLKATGVGGSAPFHLPDLLTAGSSAAETECAKMSAASAS
jgi:hypothetical protein